MTFNKWFPDRVHAPQRQLRPETRGWVLRGTWWVSTLMLALGYVLMFLLWDRGA